MHQAKKITTRELMAKMSALPLEELPTVPPIAAPVPGETIRYVLAIDVPSAEGDPYRRLAIDDVCDCARSLGLRVADCSIVIPARRLPTPEFLARRVEMAGRAAAARERSIASRQSLPTARNVAHGDASRPG